jgi:hypothetical protein
MFNCNFIKINYEDIMRLSNKVGVFLQTCLKRLTEREIHIILRQDMKWCVKANFQEK